MKKDDIRIVKKTVKFTQTEMAKIKTLMLPNENFSNYARRTILRIRPPRKFDVIRNKIAILTDEILLKIGNEEIDLDVLKKLNEIENLLKDL